MPEKPEVITVANTLKKRILNKRIKSATVYWENIIAYPSVEEFEEKIKNQKIYAISTRGKWIVFLLDDFYLLIHLRMEGKFFFREKKDKREKHEHVIFTFEDDKEMRYNDTRKFGKMLLIEKEQLYEKEPLKSLGLEFDDKNLTVSYLKEKLKKKSTPIKTALLDQSIIAGIGNIYDDEILFSSRIHPLERANEVREEKLKAIIENTNKILKSAIKKGGTTIKSYESSEGVHGLFQQELLVHTKEICPVCKGKIEKIKVNGRGTYYCPNCQKKGE